MNLFGITLGNRAEKTEVLKKVIQSLDITQEEKDLYVLSLDILNDTDFKLFFSRILSQVSTSRSNVKDYSIEPLTSQFI